MELVERLRETLETRDRMASVCPYDKPRPPAPESICSICGADDNDSCGRKVAADYWLTEQVRAILSKATPLKEIPNG